MLTVDAPSLTQSWYLLGRTQYNENHLALVERSFLTCLRLEPRPVRAEYNLELVYEKTGRPDEAVAAFRAAILWPEKAAVKDPQPLLDWACCCAGRAALRIALNFYSPLKQGGPAQPDDPPGTRPRLRQLDRTDEAIEQLRQAIALAPQTESLHFFLGRLYRKSGRTDDAALQFAEAARLAGARSSKDAPNRNMVP